MKYFVPVNNLYKPLSPPGASYVSPSLPADKYLLSLREKLSHNLIVLSNTFPHSTYTYQLRIRSILSKTHFKLLSKQVGAITDTVLEK